MPSYIRGVTCACEHLCFRLRDKATPGRSISWAAAAGERLQPHQRPKPWVPSCKSGSHHPGLHGVCARPKILVHAQLATQPVLGDGQENSDTDELSSPEYQLVGR